MANVSLGGDVRDISHANDLLARFRSDDTPAG